MNSFSAVDRLNQVKARVHSLLARGSGTKESESVERMALREIFNVERTPRERPEEYSMLKRERGNTLTVITGECGSGLMSRERGGEERRLGALIWQKSF